MGKLEKEKGPTMSLVPQPQGLLITYDVTEEQIAELREQAKEIAFDSPAAYELGRKFIAKLREFRGRVEDRRKDLKADSLEFGRRVDTAARALTSKIEELEAPLKAAMRAVDEEKARIKREAEKAELIELNNKLEDERLAREAAAKAEREAEEKRLADERARLAEETKRQEEANRAIAEQQRQERERLDAQRAELEAVEKRQALEREAAEKLERDRQAAIRAEEAKRQAELDAAAAAERAAQAAPDVEKLKAWEDRIRALAVDVPVALNSAEVREAFAWGGRQLLATADTLAGFKLRGQR